MKKNPILGGFVFIAIYVFGQQVMIPPNTVLAVGTFGYTEVAGKVWGTIIMFCINFVGQ